MTEVVVHLLDVNVLVALAVPEHVHHRRAHDWFNGVDEWASCAITENGLLRLVTQPAVMGHVVPFANALAALDQLRSDPRHRFLVDDASMTDPIISLARLASGRDITDLHLVALAARQGSVFATLDRGIPQLLEEADRRHVLVLP